MEQTIIENLHKLISHKKLGKVFKSMDSFLNVNHEEIKTHIDGILAIYRPSNELEKLIRLKIIDRYKCHDELLNILVSEDDFCISHALQCTWFFENINFEACSVADRLLAHMSYSTRLRVLKKYSKCLKCVDVSRMFFNCLKQRYGLNTALILLPACSEQFIKSVLDNISIQVPVGVLLSLYCLYPSVVISYLGHLLMCSSTRKRVFCTFKLNQYEKVFAVVAAREPHNFAFLMERYSHLIPFMKLGKRSTKQFVRVAFDSIVKNPVGYSRILNWKFVVRCLNLQQISQLQLAMLPRTVGDLLKCHSEYSDYVRLTCSLKDSIRNEMLNSNFMKAYNKEMIDYVNVMNLDLVDKLPSEKKEQWLESKVRELDNPHKKAKFISLLPPQKSIPMLKEMIKGQSDVNIRSQIVNYMFQTIIAHNDREFIGNVCQYIVSRLRNDRYIIRENAISKLSELKCLIEISEESWKPIEEIIDLMILNNEHSGYLHLIVQIISTQIHSRLKLNLPIDSHLDKLIKLSSDHYRFDLCKNTPFEKQCLTWFVNNFPEKYLDKINKAKKNDETSSLPETLFIQICEWNAYHKNDRIAVPYWLQNLIVDLFNKENYHYHKKCVMESLKKDEIMRNLLYHTIFPNYFEPGILIYKLREDPEFVAKKITVIMAKITNQYMTSYQSFFKQTKLYPALNFPGIISNICINILQKKFDESEESLLCAKRNSVRILASLLPTNQFLQIIAEFYPKQKSADDYSDEGRELFQIQNEISSCLKYVQSPSEVLESLKKFAVGDYLKLVVGSMNSIFLNIPESKILPFLNQWLECPISLRKHLFRAYFKIAPVSNTLEMLTGVFEKESHISVRMLLFEQSLRFFLKEPCTETFSVLKAVINKLQVSDGYTVNKLFEINSVPDDYVSEYLQLLWSTFVLKNEALLKDSKSKIISIIEPEILCLLDENFCDRIVEEVFDQNDMNLKRFSITYLLYSKDLEQSNIRMKKVMYGIEKLLQGWCSYDLLTSVVFNSRNTISFLVDSLVQESFNDKKKPLPTGDLLKKFKDNLLKYLQENDVLEEILLLDISYFFLNAINSSEQIYKFSEFIGPIVERIVSLYGNAQIETIRSAIIKTFSMKFSQDDNHVMEYKQVELSELLLGSPSNNCFILGLKIMPSVITCNVHKYKDLLTTILQNSNPTVKPHVNKLLKELNSSVKVE